MKGAKELLPSIESLQQRGTGTTAPHELADSVDLIMAFTENDPKGRWGYKYFLGIVKRSGRSFESVKCILKDMIDCPHKMRGGAITNRLLGKTKCVYNSQNIYFTHLRTP